MRTSAWSKKGLFGLGKKKPVLFVIWNIHNFDISPQQLDLIQQRFDADVKLASQKPLDVVLIVAGDSNVQPREISK
eukprot:3013531-Karenia_brevis.AAC.1